MGLALLSFLDSAWLSQISIAKSRTGKSSVSTYHDQVSARGRCCEDADAVVVAES